MVLTKIRDLYFAEKSLLKGVQNVFAYALVYLYIASRLRLFLTFFFSFSLLKLECTGYSVI
jgi:hypothetical protein